MPLQEPGVIARILGYTPNRLMLSFDRWFFNTIESYSESFYCGLVGFIIPLFFTLNSFLNDRENSILFIYTLFMPPISCTFSLSYWSKYYCAIFTVIVPTGGAMENFTLHIAMIYPRSSLNTWFTTGAISLYYSFDTPTAAWHFYHSTARFSLSSLAPQDVTSRYRMMSRSTCGIARRNQHE